MRPCIRSVALKTDLPHCGSEQHELLGWRNYISWFKSGKLNSRKFGSSYWKCSTHFFKRKLVILEDFMHLINIYCLQWSRIFPWSLSSLFLNPQETDMKVISVQYLFPFCITFLYQVLPWHKKGSWGFLSWFRMKARNEGIYWVWKKDYFPDKLFSEVISKKQKVQSHRGKKYS